MPGDPGDGSRRELGIQYEDPCGTGASEGARKRDEWIDRLVSYARYSGQNLLVYPLAWYHGPQFPSAREPADGFDVVVGADRKQYSRWTTQPADWYAHLLEAVRSGRAGSSRVPHAAATGQPAEEDERGPGGHQRRRRHLQQHAVEQPGPGESAGLDAAIQRAQLSAAIRRGQHQVHRLGLRREAWRPLSRGADV